MKRGRASRDRGTFASLSHRNYRIYVGGQTVSQAGTWMQVVAQAWLVLKLTNSGTALGIVAALQALPVLLLAPAGGLLVDRGNKRKLLMASQGFAGLLALAQWGLTAGHVIELWMVYALAFGLGMVNVIDNPVRQAFLPEMVPPEHLTNAVSFNSVTFNAARIIGPGLAGATITVLGIAPCFMINAISYAAVILALLAMRASELRPIAAQPRGRRQLRDGWAYVARTPELLIPVILLAVIGTVSYQFQVSLPLLAKRTFHGNAGTYGAMSVAMGIGAVIGGILIATRIAPNRRNLLRTSACLGVGMLAGAISPNLGIELAVLVGLGACSVSFLATGNSTMQLSAPPEMRGRVLSLWSLAFLGSGPVGGPLVGVIGQHAGARWGLAVGGVAAIGAAAVARPAMGRLNGGLGALAGSHLTPPLPLAPARADL